VYVHVRARHVQCVRLMDPVTFNFNTKRHLVLLHNLLKLLLSANVISLLYPSEAITQSFGWSRNICATGGTSRVTTMLRSVQYLVRIVYQWCLSNNRCSSSPLCWWRVYTRLYMPYHKDCYVLSYISAASFYWSRVRVAYSPAYLLINLLTCLLTYSLHGAESFLRS
jgi:hypothetical protein